MKRFKLVFALAIFVVCMALPVYAQAASYDVQDYPKDAYLTKSDMATALSYVFDGSSETTDSSGILTPYSRQVPERLQQLQNLYKITFRAGHLYTVRFVGAAEATSLKGNEVLYVYDANGKIVNPATLTGTISADGINLWMPTQTDITYYFGCSSKATIEPTTREPYQTGAYTFMTREQTGGYVFFNTQKEGIDITPQLLTTSPSYAVEPTPPSSPTDAFGGWYKEPECLNQWKFDDDEVMGPTTLHAKWIPNPVYHVTFDTQIMGISVEATSVNTIPAYIPRPTDPVVPDNLGVSFAGWYKEAGCVNAWNFSSDEPTGDITLFAKWAPKTFNINYVLNGGALNSDAPTMYVFDEKDVTLPVPTCKGYTFAGWYASQDLTGSQETTITKGSYGDKTFYAKWDVNSYNVSFNTQGGSTIGSLTAAYGTTIAAPATLPKKSGYVFAGWFKNSACTQVWDFTSDKVQGDTVIYAKWLPVYTVSFNSLGGSSIAPQHVTSGNKAPYHVPVRSGYLFGGWYKDSACTKRWVFAYELVRGNTTLYAKWISTNSRLSTIKKSAGTWDHSYPFKTSGGTSRINVRKRTTRMTLTPVKQNSKEKIFTKINNGKYLQISSLTMRIKGGYITKVTYKVVAQSGATRYYTVKIHRY